MDSKARPPLPPRQSQTTSMASDMDAPPPYEAITHQQKAYEKATSSSGAGPSRNGPGSSSGLMRNDPRSSSQDSLAPERGEQNERRRLLCVYIHGFMGNETSFRSFPAHVHNLLAVLLAETHVVHTKVYPRYRSRGHITFARDEFSKWLEPHERGSTDVVLLGHSMGGLMSAEVVLKPAARPASRPLEHRILGVINFDVPFLGMHPGVVKSGLSSIFKPAEEPHDKNWEGQLPTPNDADCSTPATRPSRMDTLFEPGKEDPNFNPSFANDVVLPVRKGWRNAWHFITKHSDNLTDATKKLVSSHLEFGGAMANYSELKARYARIRALEEEDGRIRQSVVEGAMPPRVRFINYYTASTGRLSKPKSPQRKSSPSPHRSRPASRASSSRASFDVGSEPGSKDGNVHKTSPSASASNLANPGAERNSDDQQWEDAMESLKIGEFTQIPDAVQTQIQGDTAGLPPLPLKPPPLGDLSYIQDKTTRELVTKEHGRAVKTYEKAVKEREKVLKDRAKTEGKQKRKESKTAETAARKTVEPKSFAPPPKPESEMTHSEREALRLQKEKQRMEAETRKLRGESEPEPEAPTPPMVTPTRSEDSAPTPPIALPTRTEAWRPSTTASTLNTVDRHDTSTLSQQASEDSQAKPKKDRKFCVLPPKDANGERDPCWVRIFMENMDEVSAHCGLFFVDERYERLVGDVAERIELWVNEEHGRRMSQAMKS